MAKPRDGLSAARADDAEGLWTALKHGDEDHQMWLREAISAFYAGQPIPIPRGSGNKEKRIAELEAIIASRPNQATKGDGL